MTEHDSGIRSDTAQPATEAGRALLDEYHERFHEADCECDASFIRDRILAIEAEAYNSGVLDQKLSLGEAEGSADVLALREALERAARDVHRLSYVTEARSDWATCEKNDCPYYRRILANTADRYTAYGAGEKVVKWPDGSDEWVDTIEGVPVDGSGNRVDTEAGKHAVIRPARRNVVVGADENIP